MQPKLVRLVIALIVVTSAVSAGASSGLLSSPYRLLDAPLSIRVPEVETMAVTCGAWSNWNTSASYCKTDLAGVLCICTTLPLSVEFADQSRSRTCTNTVTGGVTTEYQFRTKRSGCCGLEIFPCTWD